MADQNEVYIKGIREGNAAIFKEIFREYYAELCIHAMRYVNDRHSAEELVQDIFVKLWQHRNDFIINTSLRNYLHKALVNFSLNYLRSRENMRKHIEFIGFEVENSSDFTEIDATNGELDAKYRRALLCMPEKQREIFELSRFDGLKNREIAEKLGINIKTVETQMTRALSFLREQLKEYITAIMLLSLPWFF